MPAAGGAHGSGCPGHGGQRLQGGVHLTELDPASAELDLVVGAADEQQPLGVEPHQVAAAIRAGPAQRGHRRELLGITQRVQVAGQPDPADDQFTDLALGHPCTGAVDHGQVPAVQRQPDPHRATAGQPGAAGHHGGLGRSVGVPHLAITHGEPLTELGRAGLAAEDQQPHRRQLGRLPERGQRGDGGDHGHLLGDQPRAEVHPGAHQRPRRRHQAGPVPPGQPHLLAGRVERHRQSRQHPVARAERRLLQEQPGLGVDERRCRPMADRDPLRGAGRARGEDDPGVVLRLRPPGDDRRSEAAAPALQPAVRAEHGRDVRLPEHQVGPLLRVVQVDRHVRSAGRQHPEDAHVQLGASGLQPDADPVAGADPHRRQPGPARLDRCAECRVGQGHLAVVDRGRVRMAGDGLVQHVQQAAGGRRQRRPGE